MLCVFLTDDFDINRITISGGFEWIPLNPKEVLIRLVGLKVFKDSGAV